MLTLLKDNDLTYLYEHHIKKMRSRQFK